MTKWVEAIFDGRAFQPSQPVDLEPNTRVRITVESLASKTEGSESFLDTAVGLNLEGPPDWAEKIEDYLYGNNSRDDE